MDVRKIELITFEEAAKREEVSVDTVRRRITAIGAPVFKDGKDRRRLLIRVSDLQRAFEPSLVEVQAA